MPTLDPHTRPRFWRDASLPFIEAREIGDGRKVCYARHTHETFSIGVIRSGRTDYVNRAARQQVGAGTVVLMNPGDVHGCNPVGDEPWRYRMVYVDRAWLAGQQHAMGFSANQDFRPFAPAMSMAPALYQGFNRFYEAVTDGAADPLLRQCAAVSFFEQVQQSLDPLAVVEHEANHKLARAADYIADNCTLAVTLDDICAASDLSASYLIRAFRKRYGMTPHVYLLNRRIQLARGLLRKGGAIADVALQTGFADQAHFQRIFKQFAAATPGQYRR
ncbi:AraC family transcriptional regulator [Duganella radicis]|uniref:Helix-turn-helix domain-containing protein n=1 Tax=Duganella radicis TaxID=551988 RepID=A0A6L6PH95_9BURK|nr:AraC family transcriptional regulator [Duganella radicis]MTV37675.1 helix-turn-helix domain-containing protein [Duganella radicis]